MGDNRSEQQKKLNRSSLSLANSFSVAMFEGSAVIVTSGFTREFFIIVVQYSSNHNVKLFSNAEMLLVQFNKFVLRFHYYCFLGLGPSSPFLFEPKISSRHETE